MREVTNLPPACPPIDPYQLSNIPELAALDILYATSERFHASFYRKGS